MNSTQIAQLALLISGLSLVVAAGNLLWNVRSKFLHPQPRLRIRLRPAMVVREEGHTRYLHLEVVNKGPGDTVLERIAVTYRRDGIDFDEGETHASRWSDYDPVRASPFPVTVGPGRTFSAFLSDTPSVLPRRVWRIGIVDGYGRRWWAPSVQLWRAILGHRARYPEAWTPEALAEVLIKLPPVKW